MEDLGPERRPEQSWSSSLFGAHSSRFVSPSLDRPAANQSAAIFSTFSSSPEIRADSSVVRVGQRFNLMSGRSADEQMKEPAPARVVAQQSAKNFRPEM